MRTWRWYSKVLFGLAVLAFACLVWPTPWRYQRGPDTLLRVHRVTGVTEVWDDSSNYWERARTAAEYKRDNDQAKEDLDAAAKKFIPPEQILSGDEVPLTKNQQEGKEAWERIQQRHR